ncbi:hypothetical protein G7B40_017415 [Aetokthonos hydrillicola Thurmond2011]|uniref:Uncharacterized protein n=1 Tax=Aetokthonos hydrillicola Thurmond2011 TaxID=2712845 RepID=A0AAP5IC32_9CYAN|nr:hypothetical protein [Aetokthonos hydrillicola]MBO3461139.1 hypothetical protein [Aetokthonos hydrillicola CCALA 1050]MBW4588650.1 hypothetical protein [Aetokthonos hydrillicola CCALA 1050]MDR9896325.1 hypothetical protein [Aetokthonos hydrillicola Thurmond2011]
MKIGSTTRNGLDKVAQLDKSDKDAIEERLKYFFNFQENPSDNWFAQNASPELLKKVFNYIPENTKPSAIKELINNLSP